MENSNRSKIKGPTGRTTNKYLPNRKRHIAMPSVSELITLLNEHGPLELSRKMNVSKVTMHSWMNHYGLEATQEYNVYPGGTKVVTGVAAISKERSKQLNDGRSIEGDRKFNNKDQLTYAVMTLVQRSISANDVIIGRPLGWDNDIWGKMCRKPYKERIKISGALLAAEYDRLESIG